MVTLLHLCKVYNPMLLHSSVISLSLSLGGQSLNERTVFTYCHLNERLIGKSHKLQCFCLWLRILLLSLEKKAEERTMQHLSVKSSLLDSGPEKNKFGLGANEQPLCPKPRRLGPAIPEFIKPLGCSEHSQPSSEGKSGVLNMIAEKTVDGSESACTGCSPSCFAGSPPGRTGNPLVHDVQFIHQMELLSPFTRNKFSNKFGITSASPV